MEFTPDYIEYVLGVLLSIAVGFLIVYIKKLIGTEKVQYIQQELKAKEELAKIAVKFVEQAYKELKGEQKYIKASEWLSTESSRVGLKLTPEQVRGLIESAVKTMKDDFW